MKGSLSAALVIVLLLVALPAASADDETPPEPTESTTTTTTTLAPPPVDPPPEDPPPSEPPDDDAVAVSGDPIEVPRVPPSRIRRVRVTREIVFPLVGANRYQPGFGDCRDNCGREHHGIDIMTYGWKGIPVVAAHDGKIRTVRDDGEWCNVEITSSDGWYTRYIHMNNDTPGYDDSDFDCSVPGIVLGAWVEAGQIIGWIGDSGNAEFTPPHLHFEIRMPNGLPVDPYRSLKSAERIGYQRTLDEDAVTTAAEIATYAYSAGSGAVNIMATTDYALLQAGGFTTINLSVPLLLAEPDYLPQATIDAIDSLDPNRVIVVGDGLDQSLIDQLGLRFPIVERSALPAPHPDEPDKSFIGTEIEAPEITPPPFSLIVVGDRDDLSEESEVDLALLAHRMPTTVFDAAEPGRPFGFDSSRGPGRYGSRYTLYYTTGDGYTRYPAKEPPETPPEYGVFVFETKRTTDAAMAFLNSLADLPVMPLWR